MLIKCAALETANFGIRVNGVATGIVNSKARTKKEDIELKLTKQENELFLMEAAKDVPLQG